MQATLERELKLSVRPGFRLPALPGDRLPPRVFTSTYYDTPDYRLARAGVTLRRRTEGRRGAWQLKLPRGAARLELEVAGGPGHPPDEVRELVTAYARGHEPAPVATLRSRRTGVRVRGLAGPIADVVVDAVALLDGRKVLRRLRELEVELLDGDEAALGQLEQTLRAAGAADGDGRPKLFQALDLVPPAAPTPPDATAPAAEHLAAMIGAQLVAMLAYDPGTRLGSHPEDLHQMRVATRRLRALLRAARPMLATEWVEPLRAELAWLGDLLGPVRDLDVLLGHLRDQAALLTPAERRAFARLLRRLDADRIQARAAMLDALRSERYLRLLDRLEDAGRAPQVVAPETSLASIAGVEFRKLRKAMAALGEEPTDAELHAIRIRGKRARYAAELAETAVGKPASRFIRKARLFQDVLGEHQDAVVAEERLRRLIGEGGGRQAAFAAGRLVERQHARRDAARAALPGIWKKVEKRGLAAWP